MEYKFYNVVDKNLNEKSFEHLSDALNTLKQQGGGYIEKLNTILENEIVTVVSYDDLFGDDVTPLSVAWEKIDLEGHTNNGSGRCIFSIQNVSSETIAEMLRENNDWGDLDEYIDELADRAGVDIDDYEDEYGTGDIDRFFIAIQNSLGVDLGI